MLFLATSPALRIASATSLALPRPTPTRPFWSPIATIALNENRRPPFTTLAQRFTLITRSMNSDLGASDPRTSDLLEVQTAGARAVGKRLDAPVVQVAAAVEAHLLDALLLRAFRHQLAHRGRDRGLALALDARRQVLAARSRGECHAAQIVDDLGVDVLGAAEHRQTRTLGRTDHAAANAITPDAPALVVIVGSTHDDAVPAALPALRRMYSPSYLTPLPLYGSGGRNPRISAADWPTCHLSGPAPVTRDGFSTLIVMPVGGSNRIGCE